jgi:L-histidine N-alpha-methyltransferase
MTASVVPLAEQPRFTLIHRDRPAATFSEDVRHGLTATRKTLPPRWFYDALGSALFDAICHLPEYYVTRAESEILTAHANEIAAAFGTPARVVELGSGTARKTRILLDALTAQQEELEYVPVDVDAGMLERAGYDLLNEYPALRVTAVCTDFARPSIPLGALTPRNGRTVVLFLGSTIGNLEPEPARAMLRDLRDALAPGDALFLGADLRKAREVLEPAYDDALGVTGAFNRNVLLRINRELGGTFDLAAFTHRAVYDAAAGRVEMHLVSNRAQRVRIEALALDVDFAAGESIHSESSYKYDQPSLEALARDCGFTIAHTWTDAQGRFADLFLIAQ